MATMTRENGVEDGHATPLLASVALVYEQQAGRLYAYALRRVREPMDAEDVVAETFCRAIEHLDHYEQRDVPIAAWLYRIARNIIAERYRRAASFPLNRAGDTKVAEVDPGPEQALLRGEQVRSVRAALVVLSPTQRKVLWLRYGRELRYREIGCAVGQNEGTIKQAVHRARSTLRLHLTSMEDVGLPAGRPV